MKPDMSLIETWPNYYIKDKSYVSFNWNMEDFTDRLNNILNQIVDFTMILQTDGKNINAYI